jgi:hypothetical protein
VLAELGVERPDATAALHTIETAVLKTFPAIWNTFSALVHEGRESERHRQDLDREVEALFLDWAKDQGPMFITRAEVFTLTARAKRKWLRARRCQLKRLRKAHSKSDTSQPLITGFMQQPAQPNHSLMATIRAGTYLQSVSKALRRKRKRHMQRLLRDYDGFEPGAYRELLQRQEASPRPRAQRQPSPPPSPTLQPSVRRSPSLRLTTARLPRVSRRHPSLETRQPTLTAAQRRHQANPRLMGAGAEHASSNEASRPDADWPP